MSAFGTDHERGDAVRRELRPFFFDVMFLDGTSLIDRSLTERSEALDRLAGHPSDPPDRHRRQRRGQPPPRRRTRRRPRRGDGEGSRRAVRGRPPGQVVVQGEAGAHARSGRDRGRVGSRPPAGLAVEPPPGGERPRGGRLRDGWQDVQGPHRRAVGLADRAAPGPSRSAGRRAGTWCTVAPELVVEIALDGAQTSTRYPGGVALRFARVRRYRATTARPTPPTRSTACASSAERRPSRRFNQRRSSLVTPWRERATDRDAGGANAAGLARSCSDRDRRCADRRWRTGRRPNGRSFPPPTVSSRGGPYRSVRRRRAETGRGHRRRNDPRGELGEVAVEADHRRTEQRDRSRRRRGRATARPVRAHRRRWGRAAAARSITVPRARLGGVAAQGLPARSGAAAPEHAPRRRGPATDSRRRHSHNAGRRRRSGGATPLAVRAVGRGRPSMARSTCTERRPTSATTTPSGDRRRARCSATAVTPSSTRFADGPLSGGVAVIRRRPRPRGRSGEHERALGRGHGRGQRIDRLRCADESSAVATTAPARFTSAARARVSYRRPDRRRPPPPRRPSPSTHAPPTASGCETVDPSGRSEHHLAPRRVGDRSGRPRSCSSPTW